MDMKENRTAFKHKYNSAKHTKPYSVIILKICNFTFLKLCFAFILIQMQVNCLMGNIHIYFVMPTFSNS